MLEIKGLNTHYGASHILQGVDLSMPRGRIAAVLGRNGVGKTTTVKTIMGLVRPTGGSVSIDGQDITGWAPHRVRLRNSRDGGVRRVLARRPRPRRSSQRPSSRARSDVGHRHPL